MVSPKTYVLVEVKGIDAGPVDTRFGDERIEDFELTRSGGDDDPSVALLGDRAAQDHCSEFGGISSHAGSVGLDDDVDDSTWVEDNCTFSQGIHCSTVTGVFFCLPDFSSIV